MGLSDLFYYILDLEDEDPEAYNKAAELVLKAPVTTESTGLLAMMYYDGIGVEKDLEKAFEYAEIAAKENDGTALYILGHMCENAETPDQEFGGPRQKYDHYDAENFMERCSRTDSRWSKAAHLWLGDYYMDMAKGGDPEVAMEHYEVIGEEVPEAAGKLSDYYYDQWFVDMVIPEEYRTKDLADKIFHWTQVAARLNPCDYSYRMGCVYAEGIGCDAEKGFRLARKYWEDAYGFGDWTAAESIANLYEERLENLPPETPEFRKENIIKHIKSWRKLAQRERDRQSTKEQDSSEDKI